MLEFPVVGAVCPCEYNEKTAAIRAKNVNLYIRLQI
jgi:hypothetical protein